LINTASNGPIPEWSDKQWQFILDNNHKCITEGTYYLRASAAKNDPMGPWYVADLLNYYCPEDVTWLNENFPARYAKFIISNPKLTLNYLFNRISESSNHTFYENKTIVPKFLQSLFERQEFNQKLKIPILMWIAIGFLSSLILIYRNLFDNKINFLPLTIFVSGLLSTAFSALMILSETTRIASPATALIYASAIILLAEVLFPDSKESNFVSS
jgi:hypothetical protein